MAPGFLQPGEVYGARSTAEQPDAISGNIVQAFVATSMPMGSSILGASSILGSTLGSVTRRLRALPSVVGSFVGNLAGGSLEHDTPLNRSHAERSALQPYGGARRVLLLPTHSVAYIKAIKRAGGTTFEATVLSIFTGALRRFCEKADPGFAGKVAQAGGPSKFVARATTPVPLPVSPDEFIANQGLCNNFAIVSAPIALGEETPEARLASTHKAITALKASSVASVTSWQEENLLFNLPTRTRQMECLRYISLHSIDYSSVPGPPMPGNVAGSPVKAISIVLPQMLSQLILLSYDGMLYPTLTYDNEVLLDADCLSACYLEELTALGKALNIGDGPLTATDRHSGPPTGSGGTDSSN